MTESTHWNLNPLQLPEGWDLYETRNKRPLFCGKGGFFKVDKGTGYQQFEPAPPCGDWDCLACGPKRVQKLLGHLKRIWASAESIHFTSILLEDEGAWKRHRDIVKQQRKRTGADYFWIRHRTGDEIPVDLFTSRRLGGDLGGDSKELDGHGAFARARVALRLPGVGKIGTSRGAWSFRQTRETSDEQSPMALIGLMSKERMTNALDAAWEKVSPSTPPEKRVGRPADVTAEDWIAILRAFVASGR